MDSLEQLHKQLDSLSQLRDIVKTMKALSAANIRQYEQAVEALAGYYRTVELGLHVALQDINPLSFERSATAGPPRTGAVVFGSDHGLCGRFNEEIADHAVAHITATPANTSDRLVLAVGARVTASLENAGLKVADTFVTPASANQITATVQRILLQVDQWQEEANVRSVYLFYNGHVHQRSYQPTGTQLLPLDLKRLSRLELKTWPSRSLPTFTMERPTLVQRLLDQYLFVSVFRACAESQASEHASRLDAMQSAERNLDERLGDVTMNYRRARQTVITSELLDLVSGFEALEPNNKPF